MEREVIPCCQEDRVHVDAVDQVLSLIHIWTKLKIIRQSVFFCFLVMAKAPLTGIWTWVALGRLTFISVQSRSRVLLFCTP